MNTDDRQERVRRMRAEFAKRFPERAAAADAVAEDLEPETPPRDEVERIDLGELRELVKKLVDNRLRELLGESRRIPIRLLSQRSGISADALRMRCRRLGIKTVRDGRIVTVAVGDVERLLGTATQD